MSGSLTPRGIPRVICVRETSHLSTVLKSEMPCFKEPMAVEKVSTKKTNARAKSPTSVRMWPQTKTKAEILHEKVSFWSGHRLPTRKLEEFRVISDASMYRCYLVS